MKSVRCLGLFIGILIAPNAWAQPNNDPASVVKIDAKVTPYRVFWLFPQSGYNVEINLSIDEQAAVFSALQLQCQFLTKDRKEILTTMGWVTRAEFKPSADGRLVAQKTRERLPGGDVTVAECRVGDVRK